MAVRRSLEYSWACFIDYPGISSIQISTCSVPSASFVPCPLCRFLCLFFLFAIDATYARSSMVPQNKITPRTTSRDWCRGPCRVSTDHVLLHVYHNTNSDIFMIWQMIFIVCLILYSLICMGKIWVHVMIHVGPAGQLSIWNKNIKNQCDECQSATGWALPVDTTSSDLGRVLRSRQCQTIFCDFAVTFAVPVPHHTVHMEPKKFFFLGIWDFSLLSFGLRIWDFSMQSFGLRIWDFGLLSFGLRIWDFSMQSFGLRIWDFGLLSFGLRIWDFGLLSFGLRL